MIDDMYDPNTAMVARGRRGKDDRKQYTLAPLALGKYCLMFCCNSLQEESVIYKLESLEPYRNGSCVERGNCLRHAGKICRLFLNRVFVKSCVRRGVSYSDYRDNE